MDKPKLGVDVGGVIISRANDGADTSFFSDGYLQTPQSRDCFWVLRELSQRWDIFVVSKCGSKTQARTLAWFDHYDFYGETGIRQSNVHFCRKRSEKAPICQTLGLEAFIDDRLEVLAYMSGVVGRRILFRPTMSEIATNPEGSLDGVEVLHRWVDVLKLLG